MAFTTVAQVQAALARRVRDPNVVQNADIILPLISDCQRLTNAAFAGVTTDVTLTLTHRQVLYEYAAVASDIVRVLSVTADTGALLQRVDWRQLAHADPRWLHAVGDAPRHWTTIGHNLLLLHPSPPESIGRTVTIHYVQDLADVTSGSTLEIPSAHVSFLLDMAESVLLVRNRLFPSMEGADAALERHLDSKLVRPV